MISLWTSKIFSWTMTTSTTISTPISQAFWIRTRRRGTARKRKISHLSEMTEKEPLDFDEKLHLFHFHDNTAHSHKTNLSDQKKILFNRYKWEAVLTSFIEYLCVTSVVRKRWSTILHITHPSGRNPLQRKNVRCVVDKKYCKLQLQKKYVHYQLVYLRD